MPGLAVVVAAVAAVAMAVAAAVIVAVVAVAVPAAGGACARHAGMLVAGLMVGAPVVVAGRCVLADPRVAAVAVEPARRDRVAAAVHTGVGRRLVDLAGAVCDRHHRAWMSIIIGGRHSARRRLS